MRARDQHAFLNVANTLFCRIKRAAFCDLAYDLQRRTLIMLRFYALAAAIALAGVFGLIDSASAKHQHHAGHTLLGNKLQTDGKHELHKYGEHTIHVHVAKGKVTNLTVTHRTKGNVPVRKFKTSKKVVQEEGSTRIGEVDGQRHVHLIAASGTKVAQATVYYGYAFFDGTDWIIYWFPADYVVVDASWVEYTEVIG
jgi:hypothetical protein